MGVTFGAELIYFAIRYSRSTSYSSGFNTGTLYSRLDDLRIYTDAYHILFDKAALDGFIYRVSVVVTSFGWQLPFIYLLVRIRNVRANQKKNSDVSGGMLLNESDRRYSAITGDVSDLASQMHSAGGGPSAHTMQSSQKSALQNLIKGYTGGFLMHQ